VKPLTDHQRAVLDFIIKTIEEKNIAPIYREIKEHFKISITGVVDYLKVLESKGYLRKKFYGKGACGLMNKVVWELCLEAIKDRSHRMDEDNIERWWGDMKDGWFRWGQWF